MKPASLWRLLPWQKTSDNNSFQILNTAPYQCSIIFLLNFFAYSQKPPCQILCSIVSIKNSPRLLYKSSQQANTDTMLMFRAINPSTSTQHGFPLISDVSKFTASCLTPVKTLTFSLILHYVQAFWVQAFKQQELTQSLRRCRWVSVFMPHSLSMSNGRKMVSLTGS